MTRFARTLLGLAGLVLVSACEESAGGGGHAGASGWLSDLDAAKKEAKATNKPILIDFGAEW
jgi:hypothetical protein